MTPYESHKDRIVEVIRQMGTAGIPEIAEAAGMSNGAAFRYCYGMYEKGVLSRIVTGNGPVRYHLREEG
jgi:DNA-binding IclR family transcriptional regulator